MIKGSCDFKHSSPHVSYHFAKSGGHIHPGSGDVIVLVYHMTLQDNVIKLLFGFMV